MRLRPADGAVIGAVLGAVLFALISQRSSGGPSDTASALLGTTTTTTIGTTTTSVERPAPSATASSTAPNRTERPVTTTAASVAVAPPFVGADAIDALLAGLRIEPEQPRAGYHQDRFEHWDTDRNGCSVRELVLIAESRTPAQVDPYGCRVLAGDWISSYDGVATDRPEDLDVDHVVALAEAWDSGANQWDDARRRAFANDIDEPGALTAVTSTSNRSKGEGSPGFWEPASPASRCRFATDWVNVKLKWDLSADQREVDAIRSTMRTNCAGGQPLGSAH